MRARGHVYSPDEAYRPLATLLGRPFFYALLAALLVMSIRGDFWFHLWWAKILVVATIVAVGYLAYEVRNALKGYVPSTADKAAR